MDTAISCYRMGWHATLTLSTFAQLDDRVYLFLQGLLLWLSPHSEFDEGNLIARVREELTPIFWVLPMPFLMVKTIEPSTNMLKLNLVWFICKSKKTTVEKAGKKIIWAERRVKPVIWIRFVIEREVVLEPRASTSFYAQTQHFFLSQGIRFQLFNFLQNIPEVSSTGSGWNINTFLHSITNNENGQNPTSLSLNWRQETPVKTRKLKKKLAKQY